MRKPKEKVKNKLEISLELYNQLVVSKSVGKTDLYDFYINVCAYWIDYYYYGRKVFCDNSKILSVNNLFEFNILLKLFFIKR